MKTPRPRRSEDSEPSLGSPTLPRKLSVEQRRTRIVREATTLFLDRGYDAVSINDIIEVTGGSKATIYALFGDKEGLFDEVVRQTTSSVSLRIDLETTGPIEAQLAQVGRSFLTRVLDPKILEFHRMMASLGRSSPTSARLFFQAGPKTAYRAIAGWIAERQRSGELAGGDAYELAVLFHDMLISEYQLAMLTGDRADVDAAAIDRKVDAAVRLFLRGCLM